MSRVSLRRALTWVAEAPFASVPIAFLTIAERLAWTLLVDIQNRETELRDVALNWARTGQIADAFRPGSGPTAHVGAVPPLIPGTAFWIFGDTPAAAIALTILSAITIVLTAFVLNRAFAMLGTAEMWRGAAVILICLVPLHLELEARSLRVYENGTAALGLALLFFAVIRLDRRGRVGLADMFGLSALAALIVAISPVAAPPSIVMLAILALRHLDWRGRIKAAAILGGLLATTMAPWAIHTRAALGESVWTRGSFGLEFAIGTNARAVDPAYPAANYLARLDELHPDDSDPAYRAMVAAGGELPYARGLDRETWRWVLANPAAALSIWARHWLEFFFPPLWLWLHTAPFDITMPLRMLAVDLIAVLGLSAVAIGIARRNALYCYLVQLVVLLPLPYLLSQPLIRYRYILSSLLVFLAADCIARIRQGRSRTDS